jgi:hypothetical protein
LVSQPRVIIQHWERAFFSDVAGPGAATAAAEAKRSKVARKAEWLDIVRSPQRRVAMIQFLTIAAPCRFAVRQRLAPRRPRQSAASDMPARGELDLAR